MLLAVIEKGKYLSGVKQHYSDNCNFVHAFSGNYRDCDWYGKLKTFKNRFMTECGVLTLRFP